MAQPINPPDETLAARALAGDRAAFRLLVDRHYMPVYRLARSIVRNSPDAEDATQEIFVRAYEALGQFQGRGTFGAWLRRLTVNHCINRAQSTAARQAHIAGQIEAMDDRLIAPPLDNPEEQLLRSETRRRLLTELDALPAQQRAAMGMRLLEGLSYEEISDEMGVPVNSVRSWLHRGRLRLREALKETVEC